MKMYSLVLNTNDWYWWHDVVVVSRKIEKLKAYRDNIKDERFKNYKLFDTTTQQGLLDYTRSIQNKNDCYSIHEIEVV